MSFDLSWDTFALRMRITYSGADPTRNRGCTELLPPSCILNTQAASALPQLWALSHASMIVSERSYWAIRSTKIWLTSRDCWGVPRVIDLVRSLIVKL